jgi:hypothetical protein
MTGSILASSAILLTCCTPLHLSDLHSTSTAKPKSLDIVELAREPLAAFPAVAPPSLQGYSPAVSQALSHALSQASPPFHEIPPHETLNRVNEHGLAQDYTEMVSDFARSGIFDRQRLENIGSALGTRYLLQPGIGDFKETVGDRLMLAGWRLVKTRAATLRLWLRLWDTKSGKILWEAAGEATVTSELLEDMPTIPVNTIAQQLWTSMVQEHLLGEKTIFGFNLRD